MEDVAPQDQSQVWVRQCLARVEVRWLPSKLPKGGKLEGRVAVSMKQLKDGWHVRRAMAERALCIHFD